MALAAGVPDNLYWRSTPREVWALAEKLMETEARRERSAMLRAGLVASAVYNVNRPKGKPAIQPRDFLRERAPVDVVAPAEVLDRFRSFAAWHNRRVKA